MKVKKCFQKFKDTNVCSPTYNQIVMREIPCSPSIINCLEQAPNITIIK